VSKPTVIDVTFAHSVERDGWHDIPPGVRCYGSYEKEFELRAAVTFHGLNDAPEVEWLDKAAVEDLGLEPEELTGAEEQAIEAAADVMRKRAEDYEDPAIARADYEYDQRKDDAIFGRAS
jgi:hypothetical protein